MGLVRLDVSRRNSQIAWESVRFAVPKGLLPSPKLLSTNFTNSSHHHYHYLFITLKSGRSFFIDEYISPMAINLTHSGSHQQCNKINCEWFKSESFRRCCPVLCFINRYILNLLVFSAAFWLHHSCQMGHCSVFAQFLSFFGQTNVACSHTYTIYIALQALSIVASRAYE